LYKEEYLALINDPRKWVQFISDNLSIVQNGSKLAWHAAAQAANSQDYDTAKKMYEDSVGLLGNYMTWITSIDPIWVTKTLKENAAKKMHTDRAM